MRHRGSLRTIALAALLLSACRGSEPAATPKSAALPDTPALPVSDAQVEPSALEEAPAESELTPREHDRRGDEHLRAGRFDEAILDFDRYLEAQPEADPYHWRRGIAYYYAGRYAEGAAQFERHRGVNPADVENAAWHYLCKARELDLEAARAALLPVAPDGRPPMMTVYELFAGRATPQDVLDTAMRTQPGLRESALFYGHLYIGLYHETQGDLEAARHHIELSATTHGASGYMGDIARVHAALLAP